MHVMLVDDEQIARKRLARLLNAMPHIQSVKSCASGQELLESLQENPVDVILLDIQIPDFTGLELFHLLPEDDVAIIFVTAYPEHATTAFDLGVVDYIVKPVTAERLKKAIERASNFRQTHHYLDRIPIKTHKGVQLVDIEQVSHASYNGTLVTLYIDDGELVTALTLSELESRLSGFDFIRVHRRHLIRLSKIDRLKSVDSGGYIAYMKNGMEAVVSRQSARELRRKLGLTS